jgi:hypothetical protein
LPCLAAEGHHRDVEDRNHHIRLAGHRDHLDHQEPVRGPQPFATPHQDLPALRVRPVVQDLAEDPHVALNLDRLEEASGRPDRTARARLVP